MEKLYSYIIIIISRYIELKVLVTVKLFVLFYNKYYYLIYNYFAMK